MQRPLDIGYQISLEQFQPEVALEHVILAEKAGFDSIWASDHFLPWFHTDAACSFAWSFISSAAQATKKIKFGTGITCPILRYHPAIVAQAFATMERMHNSRIFLSLATGEALNEVPVGYKWPSFNERVGRLEEAVEITRKLWTGELVSYRGKYYRLNKAKLYSPPLQKIPIYVAASGPTVARMAGRVGDGFLTPPATEETYNKVLFPALEEGLKETGRTMDQISKSVEVWMTYDEKDKGRAIQAARPWAGSIMPVFFKLGVYDPREIEAHGNLVGNEQLSEVWIAGTSAEPFIKTIEKYAKLGFDQIHVTSSSPSQEKFIELFRKEVIPYFKS